MRDSFYEALKALGFTVEKDPDSGARLIIQAPAGKQLGNLDILAAINPLPNGPKIHQRIQGSAAAVPTMSFRIP